MVAKWPPWLNFPNLCVAALAHRFRENRGQRTVSGSLCHLATHRFRPRTQQSCGVWLGIQRVENFPAEGSGRGKGTGIQPSPFAGRWLSDGHFLWMFIRSPENH
jgi:hypothetical protein